MLLTLNIYSLLMIPCFFLHVPFHVVLMVVFMVVFIRLLYLFCPCYSSCFCSSVYCTLPIILWYWLGQASGLSGSSGISRLMTAWRFCFF
ncbi:hypothetical protein BGX38DRAFT_402594 [Terfezia claveryi]|nr:hypothetical protein BGX38DRAFT_402594 [Terfezia claveryi]